MRATTPPDVRSLRESAGAWAIVALVIVSAALALEHALTHPDPFAWWTIDLVAAAALPGVLMYAGYRLARTDFEPSELWAVTRWCFAGVVVLTLIGGWIILSQFQEGGALAEPLFMVLMLAVAGAIGGLAVGVRETSVAQSIDSVDAPREDGTTTDREAARSDRPMTDRDPVRSDRSPTERRVRALDDPERWLLVEWLATNPGSEIGLWELARALARRQAADGSNSSPDAVAARLHHVHLPMLDGEGLVEYDAASKTVEYDGEKLSNTWIDDR